MSHDATPSPASAERPPEITGPGVFESVCWTVGYQFTQVIVAVGLIVFAFSGWPSRMNAVVEVLDQMADVDVEWLTVCLTGGATLGALFLIVPAVFWRLRPRPRTELGDRLPDRRNLVLLAGAVLPLAVLSDELYRAASGWWEAAQFQLAPLWPAMGESGQQDTISLVRQQAQITAYPLLLVIFGVGPAIGEELVFRGVIGRGLVNRHGVVPGVLITSLLFALAHGTPAHAVATLPLAVFLHLTYLATRTIWAPIVVHFLNNALSVTMLKYNLGMSVEPSVLLLGSAVLYSAAIGIMLWHSRGEYGLSSPLLAKVGVPSRETIEGGRAVSATFPQWQAILVTTGAVTFTWMYVSAAMAGS